MPPGVSMKIHIREALRVLRRGVEFERGRACTPADEWLRAGYLSSPTGPDTNIERVRELRALLSHEVVRWCEERISNTNANVYPVALGVGFAGELWFGVTWLDPFPGCRCALHSFKAIDSGRWNPHPSIQGVWAVNFARSIGDDLVRRYRLGCDRHGAMVPKNAREVRDGRSIAEIDAEEQFSARLQRTLRHAQRKGLRNDRAGE